MEDDSLLKPATPVEADEDQEPEVQETKPLKAAASDGLYPFHLSNIHEQCMAAYVMRAVPLTIFVLTLVVSAAGAVMFPYLLLVTSAFFNVWMWLWLVSYSISTIRATRLSQDTVRRADQQIASQEMKPVRSEDVENGDSCAQDAVHLVILPNYKEDESILADTLEALSQAIGSKDFRVVLAMEEREGKESAQKKARSLQDRFGGCFADLCSALHPLKLEELHLDGSTNAEVPGKSSNLKWAVSVGSERCSDAGLDIGKVVLTVADADCIFHPGYFHEVGKEFVSFREAAATSAAGSSHPWTIWQAPQLPFRNYYSCLAPARLWGYVATVYEFGGVGGLVHGGFHMTFSSFSLPLKLVAEATPWDGDVIADDHHCYLKCFLYNVFKFACDQQKAGVSGSIDPPLVVRPIMLPVKSTSVVADGCLNSWQARFNQAKRHSQGVAELAYILLGCWNLLCTLPWRCYSLALVRKLFRVVLLPFSINMLPICQAFPLAAVTIVWFLNGGKMNECPSTLWSQLDDPLFYTCALAGGMNLGFPMVVPVALVIAANSYMLDACFVQPGESDKTIWCRENGQLPRTLGSKRLTALIWVAMDAIFLLPIVMPIYGMIPAVMAYWNCLVNGNHFDFVSASKIADSAPGRKNSRKLTSTIGRSLSEDDEAMRRRQSSSSVKTPTAKTPKSGGVAVIDEFA